MDESTDLAAPAPPAPKKAPQEAADPDGPEAVGEIVVRATICRGGFLPGPTYLVDPSEPEVAALLAARFLVPVLTTP